MISEGLADVGARLLYRACAKGCWGVEDDAPFDAMISLNMVHIAPWEAALGLLASGRRLLRQDGVLFLLLSTIHDWRQARTARTNAAFRRRPQTDDPRWGVRDIDDIVSEAMSQRARSPRSREHAGEQSLSSCSSSRAVGIESLNLETRV